MDERHIAQLTPEQAKDLFESTARIYMGMSGEEFLLQWDRGKLTKNTRAERVAIMIPLVRRIKTN